MLDMALDHFKAGRLAEAADCCGKLLNRTSRNFQALHLLGRIRIKQGAFEEAVFFLSAALGAGSPDPNDTAATLNDLVSAELAQGHIDAAIDRARRALAIQPDNPVALQALGIALYKAERFDEAIDAYHQGLAAQPKSAGIYNNLGNALRAAGKPEEAAEAYRRAVAMRPDTAELHANLGHVLFQLECIDEAVECYRRVIVIDPDDADIRAVLGALLRPRKEFEEACEHYRHALQLRPDEPELLFGLGAALLGQFRCEEALGHLQRAAALRPAHVETRGALGNALVGMNRVPEALREYRAGRALQPDSPELIQNEAFALVMVGNGSEGWREMEARLSLRRDSPLLLLPADMPHWRGETSIDGKTILLQFEQGLGDTLMMVRYVPLVARQGARVLLRVQPLLGKVTGGHSRCGCRADILGRAACSGYGVPTNESATGIWHRTRDDPSDRAVPSHAAALPDALADTVGQTNAAAYRHRLAWQAASAISHDAARRAGATAATNRHRVSWPAARHSADRSRMAGCEPAIDRSQHGGEGLRRYGGDRGGAGSDHHHRYRRGASRRRARTAGVGHAAAVSGFPLADRSPGLALVPHCAPVPPAA